MTCNHLRALSLNAQLQRGGKKHVISAIQWCPDCQKTLEVKDRFLQVLNEDGKSEPNAG